MLSNLRDVHGLYTLGYIFWSWIVLVVETVVLHATGWRGEDGDLDRDPKRVERIGCRVCLYTQQRHRRWIASRHQVLTKRVDDEG